MSAHSDYAVHTGHAVHAVHSPLVFSHANGFPASSYRKLFEALAPRFKVGAVESFGTDPRYQVTDGWPQLVRQLLDYIAHNFADIGPVVGVGHSLGGMLTLRAAIEQPQLFSAIVLLDSPLIGALSGATLRIAKRLGLIDRITPARATSKRRSVWPDSKAALEHLASRPLYRDFDPECLHDYVHSGTVLSANERSLRISPAIESAIYKTIPHDLAHDIHRLTVPAGMLLGRRSSVLRQVGMRASRRHFKIRMIDGGHLFPLEHPQATAEAIASLTTDLGLGES